MARKRVLVVEDDPIYAQFYRDIFDSKKNEFALSLVASAEEATAVFEEAAVDLAILDWNLPGKNGMDLLKWIRSNEETKDILVFFATVKGDVKDRVHALEAGADDYIIKPIDHQELVARLHSLIRRESISRRKSGLYDLDGLKFDPESGDLLVGKKSIRLFPKERLLLDLFLRHPNVLHSSRYLWDTFWDYPTSHWEHTLESHISSLRGKLGNRWAECLQARKGMGYILIAREGKPS